MSITLMLAVPAIFASRRKALEVDREGVRYFIGGTKVNDFPLWRIRKVETKFRARRYTAASYLNIWEDKDITLLNFNDWEFETEKMKQVFRELLAYQGEYKFEVDDKLKWLKA